VVIALATAACSAAAPPKPRPSVTAAPSAWENLLEESRKRAVHRLELHLRPVRHDARLHHKLQLRPRQPGLADVEIRKVICTTNAIESVNARLRRAVNARGHFPTEQAALKCLYMALMGMDPTGKGQGAWVRRWKPALNAFDIHFDGRLSAGRI
jgi:hypothetical protein